MASSDLFRLSATTRLACFKLFYLHSLWGVPISRTSDVASYSSYSPCNLYNLVCVHTHVLLEIEGHTIAYPPHVSISNNIEQCIRPEHPAKSDRSHPWALPDHHTALRARLGCTSSSPPAVTITLRSGFDLIHGGSMQTDILLLRIDSPPVRRQLITRNYNESVKAFAS